MKNHKKLFVIIGLLMLVPIIVGAIGKATNFIGTNDADNAATSATVVSNRDGSLLERNEYVIDQLATIVADTPYIADSALPASPTAGSLAAQVELCVYNESVLLHEGSVANVFTITGGPVAITAIIAETYSTVSANACGLTLTADPANGYTDTALQTSAIDINGMVAGSIISWSATSNAADGAIRVPGTSLPYGSEQPIIVPEGTLDLTLANSNPTSGGVHFYIRYFPLRNDAKVTGD